VRLRFGHAHYELVIAQRASSTPDERARALPPRDAALQLRPFLARLGERELHRLLDGPHAPARSLDVSRLHDELTHMLADGRLLVLRKERRRVIEQVEDATPVLGPQAEPTSWISVELVDDDGNPVPNMPFQVTDPDGKVWNATTNMAGKARLDGMNAGSCKVTFTTLEDVAWSRA
jgi:hypothetical protein